MQNMRQQGVERFRCTESNAYHIELVPTGGVRNRLVGKDLRQDLQCNMFFVFLGATTEVYVDILRTPSSSVPSIGNRQAVTDSMNGTGWQQSLGKNGFISSRNCSDAVVRQRKVTRHRTLPRGALFIDLQIFSNSIQIISVFLHQYEFYCKQFSSDIKEYQVSSSASACPSCNLKFLGSKS